MSILEFAEDIFSLRTNVTSLKDKVTELSNTVLDHEKRIIRLEGSEDRILANAKAAAMEQTANTYAAMLASLAKLNINADFNSLTNEQAPKKLTNSKA